MAAARHLRAAFILWFVAALVVPLAVVGIVALAAWILQAACVMWVFDA